MRSPFGVLTQCLSLCLLGTLSVGSLSRHPRESSATHTVAAAPLHSSAGAQNSTADLFARLTSRHHWQEAHLDRLSVMCTYKIENDKDKILAEEVVVMEYRAPGTVTFTSISEKGSAFVRHHVFQRLMKDEEKRVRVNKDPDSLVTPANYTLKVVGMDRIGSSDCFVVQAIPKHKETDLFEGTIWIDHRDFAIVKITGQLAKSPSLWIKRVDFVRDYQKIGGFWLLSREEAGSVVRIFGKETLTIAYRNYTVNGSGAAQSSPTNGRTSVVVGATKLSKASRPPI